MAIIIFQKKKIIGYLRLNTKRTYMLIVLLHHPNPKLVLYMLSLMYG